MWWITVYYFCSSLAYILFSTFAYNFFSPSSINNANCVKFLFGVNGIWCAITGLNNVYKPAVVEFANASKENNDLIYLLSWIFWV